MSEKCHPGISLQSTSWEGGAAALVFYSAIVFRHRRLPAPTNAIVGQCTDQSDLASPQPEPKPWVADLSLALLTCDVRRARCEPTLKSPSHLNPSKPIL